MRARPIGRDGRTRDRIRRAQVRGSPQGSGDAVPHVQDRSGARPASSVDEKRQFVDLQNDVTVADLRSALAEGFADIEHVKRYTATRRRHRTGTDQRHTGRCDRGGTAGAEIPRTVDVSRPRPPYHPVTLQSLAGLRVGAALRVTRRTPLHAWHDANGGVLEPMGLWLRPRHYRANGADAFGAAVAEARRVRTTGGILDASTLGKIEIAGPDAAAFLDTLHLSPASTIKVGRAKYMVSLREDGMVLDDGLMLRPGPQRFIATTSSSHADRVLSHYEHYRDIGWAAGASRSRT